MFDGPSAPSMPGSFLDEMAAMKPQLYGGPMSSDNTGGKQINVNADTRAAKDWLLECHNSSDWCVFDDKIKATHTRPTTTGTTPPLFVLDPKDDALLTAVDTVAGTLGLSITPSEIIKAHEKNGPILQALEARIKELEDTPVVSGGGEWTVNVQIKDDDGTVSDDWPTLGSVAKSTVSDLFGEVHGASKGLLDMEVTHFEWDGDHPMIMQDKIIPHYRFHAESLWPVLKALETGQGLNIVGHTGTGKSTLVQQVCLRLGRPCHRTAFMDEITRHELIGRERLTVDPDTGQTVSVFEPGELTKYYGLPVVHLLDEYDAITPGASYIFQPLFEGSPLVVSEDGGRLIERDPQHRFIATGNTTGSGDETGMYNATRPQSAAQVNRWAWFVNVEYMDPSEEWQLLCDSVDGIKSLAKEVKEPIMKYIAEHRKAFVMGECGMPLSPRNIKAFGEAYMGSRHVGIEHAEAFINAAKLSFINRCTISDREVLTGILDAVTK